MVRRFVLALGALSLVFALAGRSATASNVTMWVTPSSLAPHTKVTVVVHLRRLPPLIAVSIAVSPPVGTHYGMGYNLGGRDVKASGSGAIDLAVNVAIADPGLYSVTATWGTGAQFGQTTIGLPVPAPVTTNCGGGPPIAHVFNHTHEVLLEGKIARLGGTVGLLGLGYPPCRPVSYRWGFQNADVVFVKTGKHTDRYGTFRLVITIPKCTGCMPRTTYQVTPIVDAVLGPDVLIALASP